jgi:hypothetical protein
MDGCRACATGKLKYQSHVVVFYGKYSSRKESVVVKNPVTGVLVYFR